MAINFEKFKGITTPPRLREGYYQGRLVDLKEIPAHPATETTAAKAEQLVLTFEIPYLDTKLRLQQWIANHRSEVTIKNGPRAGETFQPIGTFIDPIRAQADDDTLDLAGALEWAATHDTNLGYHRDANNYLKLKVVYPQVSSPDEADVSIDLPTDI